MRTIRISDEVWDAIASRGRFGETPDDVLRRVFHLTPRNSKRRQAQRRMTTRLVNGHLSIAFADGPEKTWQLPLKQDKAQIREVRNHAVAFAQQQGATDGQIKGLIRVLTGAGYHIIK